MLSGHGSPLRQGFGLSPFSFPSLCHISMNSWFLSLAGKQTGWRRTAMYTLQLALQKPKPQVGPLPHSTHMKLQLSLFLADTVHFFLSFYFNLSVSLYPKNTGASIVSQTPASHEHQVISQLLVKTAEDGQVLRPLLLTGETKKELLPSAGINPDSCHLREGISRRKNPVFPNFQTTHRSLEDKSYSFCFILFVTLFHFPLHIFLCIKEYTCNIYTDILSFLYANPVTFHFWIC